MANDYGYLKKALLETYQLTVDDYRRKFFSVKQYNGENYTNFWGDLEYNLDQWLGLSNVERTFEGLRELLLKEQFLCSCPKDMAIFLKEHAPVDQKSMLDLAEKYEMAHKFVGSEQARPMFSQGGTSKASNIPASGNPPNNRPAPFPIKCYICNKVGHKANQCQQTNANYNKPSQSDCHFPNRHNSANAGIVRPSLTHDCSIDQSEAQLRCGCSVPVLGNACVEYQQNLPTSMGYVGDEAVRIMRDTGCNGVVVNKNKIKLDEFTGQFKYLIMLDRTMLNVPVARCTIRTPWLSGEVTAMCLDSPVYDLIVGNYSSDVINQGVELPCSGSVPKPSEHVQTTDSCENETYISTYDASISDQLESNNEVSPVSVDKTVSGNTQISVGCTVETRGSEKRNKDTFKPLPVPEQIDTSARDFKAAQKSDP